MTTASMPPSGDRLAGRVVTLRSAVPLSLAAIAVVFQLGPARLVHDRFGHETHYAAEIVFYATTGPFLAYWILTRIGRWIDEKQLAEQQARASERRLASITSASADAILSLDSTGLIASWNRGAELTFGYATEEILGRPLTDLLGGGGRPGLSTTGWWRPCVGRVSLPAMKRSPGTRAVVLFLLN